MLWQCLSILLRLTFLASTFCIVPLYVWFFFQNFLVHLAGLLAFFLTSCSLRWSTLEFGGGHPWISMVFFRTHSLPGPYPMGVFQEEPWRGNLFFWSPWLRSCCLPCFALTGSRTHSCWSQGQPWLSWCQQVLPCLQVSGTKVCKYKDFRKR